MGENRYVVRMEDPEGPKYYVGSGYAGAGKPVPYFYCGLTRERTKLYKTVKGAQEAADKFGGRVGVVELDESGAPQWLGYVLEIEDSFGQEKSVNVDAFDAAAGAGPAAEEEVPADQKAAGPEGWRERQARIRREMATYQKRKREQRKAAKG